jgi:hypothetical protein
VGKRGGLYRWSLKNLANSSYRERCFKLFYFEAENVKKKIKKVGGLI